MKNILFIFTLLVVGVSYAQELPTTTSRRIKPIPLPAETNNTGSLLFPKTEQKKKYIRPSKKPTIDLTQKTDLLDPGSRFNGTTFKSDAAPVDFINDTYLGEIRTGKATLKMTLWDPRLEDGDRVRIWLNDKVIITDLYLTNAAQGFDINLVDGFNKVEIEALNQGYSAPNTSGIVIRDDDGTVNEEKVCMINAGVKSLLIVIKE